MSVDLGSGWHTQVLQGNSSFTLVEGLRNVYAHSYCDPGEEVGG